MSGSINKVTLIGRLGKDPEIVSLNDGNKIVKFSIATSDVWNDRNTGERRERTEWHNVVIFNEHLGGVAERFLRKGGQVYIEGALQTRKWQDQSGNDRYTTEVVLQRYRGELTLLGSRGDSGGGSQYDGGGSSRDGGGSSDRRDSSENSEGAAPPPMGGDMDDDIPF